jgi:hypothetical protein
MYCANSTDHVYGNLRAVLHWSDGDTTSAAITVFACLFLTLFTYIIAITWAPCRPIELISRPAGLSNTSLVTPIIGAVRKVYTTAIDPRSIQPVNNTGHGLVIVRMLVLRTVIE